MDPSDMKELVMARDAAAAAAADTAHHKYI